MIYTKFITIVESIYGRVWQAQLADYLMISRKTVSSWADRQSIPAWVDAEINPLIARNLLEAKFAQDSLGMSDDDFYHARAILIGQVGHYDVDRYSFADIKQFIENQIWTVTESAKYNLRSGDVLSDVLNWIEAMFLSENDIASYLERNDAALGDVCEIQNMRGDACSDVIESIKDVAERYIK